MGGSQAAATSTHKAAPSSRSSQSEENIQPICEESHQPSSQSEERHQRNYPSEERFERSYQSEESYQRSDPSKESFQRSYNTIPKAKVKPFRYEIEEAARVKKAADEAAAREVSRAKAV